MCPNEATRLSMECCFSALALLNPAKRVGLVQSGHLHYFIECNLFLPWYNWNIAHLVINNDHSITLWMYIIVLLLYLLYSIYTVYIYTQTYYCNEHFKMFLKFWCPYFDLVKYLYILLSDLHKALQTILKFNRTHLKYNMFKSPFNWGMLQHIKKLMNHKILFKL